LAIIVFFLDDFEEKKPTKMMRTEIVFRIPKVAEVKNVDKQKALFEEVYQLNNYKVDDLLEKANKLHKILNNGENKDALVELGITKEVQIDLEQAEALFASLNDEQMLMLSKFMLAIKNNDGKFLPGTLFNAS